MINIIMGILLSAITLLIAVLFALLFLKGQVRNAKVKALDAMVEVDTHEPGQVVVEKKRELEK